MQSGGSLQVALSLLSEWNAGHKEHQYFIFLSPQLAPLIDEKLFDSNFHFYYFDKNPTYTTFTALTFHRGLTALERAINPDTVFTVFGPALWKPKSNHIVGFANGYYLFDDSDYIRKKVLTGFLQRTKYYVRRFLIFRQLKKEAATYWVETIIAKKRLEQLFAPNIKIEVVGNTYGASFKNKALDESSSNNLFNLLYLTAYYPHKNIEIIPKVIVELKKRNVSCCFLLTLSNAVFNKIFDSETDKNYVQNLATISPDDAARVYQCCDAVFVPSLLETFSANYPEAMKSNKPILTSDLDFAHQICGDAALYFNPINEHDIADKIELLMSNKSFQEHLIAEGQQQLLKLETPESRADKLMRLIEQSCG
jgi:glycosyltransferase involved in cell wall biosynthesis